MTRSKFAYYDDKNIIPPSTNWFHCHLPSRLLFMRSTAMTWRGRKIATRGVLCLAKQWNPWPVLSLGGVHKLRRQVLGLFLDHLPPYFVILYLSWANFFQELLFLHQYDYRLFMELPWKLQEHGQNMFCSCTFHGNFMDNLLLYCGLLNARISVSEKDLPVQLPFLTFSSSILM